MRPKTYFKLCFLLPLVLPLLAVPFQGLGFEGLGVLFILEASLFIGGIPYLLFLIGILLWMRDKNYRQVQRFTFLAPLLFIPLFIICAMILSIVQLLVTGEMRVEAEGVATLCIFILIVGYFYVLVTNGGFYLLRSMGFIWEEEEWERAEGERPKERPITFR